MPFIELPALSYACRRGMLYERHTDKEISAIAAWDEPVALDLIQTFRGKIYAETGSPHAVDETGKHIHPGDGKSYQVICINRTSELLGAARYERIFRPNHNCWVELGGFAIVPSFRGSRVVLAIIKKIKEMAVLFGDKRLFAHASVQYGSSSILRKMGGKVVTSYYHPQYERSADVLEIHLD